MTQIALFVAALALMICIGPFSVFWAKTALADLHIAAVGPVTGPHAGQGEQMLAGAHQAVEGSERKWRRAGRKAYPGDW